MRELVNADFGEVNELRMGTNGPWRHVGRDVEDGREVTVSWPDREDRAEREAEQSCSGLSE